MSNSQLSFLKKLFFLWVEVNFFRVEVSFLLNETFFTHVTFQLSRTQLSSKYISYFGLLEPTFPLRESFSLGEAIFSYNSRTEEKAISMSGSYFIFSFEEKYVFPWIEVTFTLWRGWFFVVFFFFFDWQLLLLWKKVNLICFEVTIPSKKINSFLD